MKTIITFLAVMALTATSFAGGTQNAVNWSTNSIASSTNLHIGPTLALTKCATVGFQMTFSCTASNTGTVAVIFDESIDNSNWKTNVFQISATANGTSKVTTGVTNRTVGAIPFMRIGRVEVPGGNNTSALTNLTVTAFTKDGI